MPELITDIDVGFNGSSFKEHIGRGANDLNIIIHPLFIPPDDPQITEEYRTARINLCKALVADFCPQTSADTTILMPSKGSRRRDENVSSGPKDFTSWVNLLASIRSQTRFPRNVRIADDITGPDVTHPYAVRGKTGIYEGSILPATTVTVGGEWADACVAMGIEKLFTLRELNRLRLDKQCSLDSTIVGKGKGLTSFIARFKDRCEVDNQDRYIYLTRKVPAQHFQRVKAR